MDFPLYMYPSNTRISYTKSFYIEDLIVTIKLGLTKNGRETGYLKAKSPNIIFVSNLKS